MWNPVDPEIVESPHPFWAWLRREDPVSWVDEPDGRGFWAVTRYQDIVTVKSESGEIKVPVEIEVDKDGRPIPAGN